MTKKPQVRKVVFSSFYLVMGYYWLRFAYLGLQIFHIQTLGQAETVLNTRGLFSVRFVSWIVSSFGDIPSVLPFIIEEIPVAFCVFMFVWLRVPFSKSQNALIRIHLGVLILGMALFFTLIAFLMSSIAISDILRTVNLLGLGIFLVSVVMFLSLLIFLLLDNKLGISSDNVE